MSAWPWIGGALAGLVLITGARTGRLPLSFAEAVGFVTGLWCVALVVRGSIWNFPVGLANNLFLGVVFWESRLYSDMTLQGVYFLLGIWGWTLWARGSQDKTPLRISRTPVSVLLALLAFVVGATALQRELLILANGAAPFLDALTTSLSLSAQFLLNRKKLENWWFWILADLIYIPFYASRGLWLTSALYICFLVLCLVGVREWRRELTAAQT